MATSSRGIRAGRAFVELFANDSKLVRGLQSAQRRLRAFAGTVRNMGAKLLTAGGIAAAPLAAAVKAASNLEEVMNKFRVVFGDNADDVKSWGDEFAGQVGRSKRQVAEFLAASQDLLVPIGVDQAQAVELSKTLAGLAVDLASFNNMQDADVMRDLQAALTGSGETMKKYGVVVSMAAVKQELLNKGLDPKNATEAEKALARLDIILRGTTAAQGDAIRSAGGFANRLKAVRAKVEDAAASLGQALLPVLAPVLHQVANVTAAVGAWMKANPQLALTVLKVTAAVVGAGVALVALSGVLSALGTVLGVVAGLFTALGVAIGALLTPVGLVVAGVTAATVAWMKWTESGQQALAFIQSGFAPMVSKLSTTFGLIRKAISQGQFTAAFKFMAVSVSVVWEDLMAELWVQFKTFIANAIKGLAKLVKHLMNLPHKALGMDTTNFKNSSALFKAARALEPNRGEKLETFVGGKKVGEFATTPEARAQAERDKRFADAAAELAKVLDAGQETEKELAQAVHTLSQTPAVGSMTKSVPEPEDLADKIKTSSAGTFNPFAIRGFSDDRLQERIAKATEATAKGIRALAGGNNRTTFE